MCAGSRGCSVRCYELFGTNVEAGVPDRTAADAVSQRASPPGLVPSATVTLHLSGCRPFRGNAALGRRHPCSLWGVAATTSSVELLFPSSCPPP